MKELFDALTNLEIRLISNHSTNSRLTTPAIFQVCSPQAIIFPCISNICTQFSAFYRHNGTLYPHPYTLETIYHKNSQNVPYAFSIYLKLKRLRDFSEDDLKRYYEVIDQRVDGDGSSSDFHDVYLVLNYEVDGQWHEFNCNSNRPLNLPTFNSNTWTSKNTLTRFRYDAENRDGTLPCEMTLCYPSSSNLDSYNVVICVVANTMPPKMDFHELRWYCKLKQKSKGRTSNKRNADEEKPFCLHNESGFIIAQVYGPDRKFTPHMYDPKDQLNYVRSYSEPNGFRNVLENAVNRSRENGLISIAVTKEADYFSHIRNRRRNTISQYLPFDEMQEIDLNPDVHRNEIVKRLKCHKEQRSQQLTLWLHNESETYSQIHVRLYVAAYDENNTLLTETLHPPIRNSKLFEQLKVIRIVQPKTSIQANDPVYFYCDYDYNRSRSEYTSCPYTFDLCFVPLSNMLTNDQICQLFKKPHRSEKASYVPNCQYLLQFNVPDIPQYDNHRVYVRLRHEFSKDYNSSDIALTDATPYIYYANPTTSMDADAEKRLNRNQNYAASTEIDRSIDYELITQPIDQWSHANNIISGLLKNDDDSNDSDKILQTPDIDIERTPSKRFMFPGQS